MTYNDPIFWLAALEIIWINILLSGDNAVVIALACRGLPPKQRTWGIALGAGAAVLLRIIFTVLLAQFLEIPFLKFIGGCALVWIAIKLLLPEPEHAEGDGSATESLWRAVWLVVVADLVMSLDNVIAIAAAAKGSTALIIFGLVVSVPLVIAGSALIMKAIDSYPWLVWLGAGLLGFVAGEIMAEDQGILTLLKLAPNHALTYSVAAVAVVVVLGVGSMLRSRRTAHGSA